ncbi:hypothetical protein AAE269_003364 [Escherichia coli]|uniref:Uncharacterized protein n=3 Tax=Enterobacteriaceae TaxID=543 RepID=A0A2W7U8K6_ECOLX|nr:MULTISPECIES: hypothetical protein [Escherichia]EFA8161084.1 hypothetical protein [Escherichia coli O103]EFT1062624.1 hypothetical protein [Shigella sonnei]EFW3282204.1 hypothetical protein [Shigella flexneri]EIG5924795.1 hypothetical protein [Escherichia coli O45:H2]EIH5001754.1 hypothetical protein [Shigella boydii]EKM2483835.1 hypothetical protein [Escherichia coli O157]HDR9893691.1 hypothetical protein [Escherichia coli 87-1713 (10i)]
MRFYFYSQAVDESGVTW